MTVGEVRATYLEFFKSKGHAIVPSAPLVPENDPTTLFTGSGMQPMLPYLLGEKHPSGKRIVDSQKCFRSQDIEEVGDNRHTTFFEMLGNWSLGDYWKEEQLSWIYEFLTKELGIQKERLWVTCFEGDANLGLPKDDESAEIWEKLGIPKERIRFYGVEKNWWSRSGTPEKMPIGEPGGPDSEVFYEFTQIPHDKKFGEECHPNCDCGRFMEIGNSVFMEYRKVAPRTNLSPDPRLRRSFGGQARLVLGAFEKLQQRNVDFGGGLERITAAVNNEPDVFRLDVFDSVVNQLERLSGKSYTDKALQKSFRIIADHVRVAVFFIGDGVIPSNVERGYFCRRLVRRAVRHWDLLGIQQCGVWMLADTILEYYKRSYPNTYMAGIKINEELKNEEEGFREAYKQAMKIFERYIKIPEGSLGSTIPSADMIFELITSHGLSKEIIDQEVQKRGIEINWEKVEQELKKHRELSRAGADKKFKGGLADTSEMSVKYHTATHLLHQALRDVLGTEVQQKGSNITPERLRFDFSFGRKMTDEEKKKVEDIVNAKITASLPVQKTVLPLAEAEKTEALHFFGEKYGDMVNVYYIGDSLETAYSKEFCGGPHVENTGTLGTFTMQKEEAVSAGVRRIKAVLL